MRMSQPEHAVLAALVAVHREHGRATVRDVAAARQRTTSATARMLHRLEARGLVAWGPAGSLRPRADLVLVGGDVYVCGLVP